MGSLIIRRNEHQKNPIPILRKATQSVTPIADSETPTGTLDLVIRKGKAVRIRIEAKASHPRKNGRMHHVGHCRVLRNARGSSRMGEKLSQTGHV